MTHYTNNREFTQTKSLKISWSTRGGWNRVATCQSARCKFKRAEIVESQM